MLKALPFVWLLVLPFYIRQKVEAKQKGAYRCPLVAGSRNKKARSLVGFCVLVKDHFCHNNAVFVITQRFFWQNPERSTRITSS
ncbi:hypothetical protein QI600_004135 [Salmonella enterica]|nr:hypothetical protein [Salmonella enterica]